MDRVQYTAGVFLIFTHLYALAKTMISCEITKDQKDFIAQRSQESQENSAPLMSVQFSLAIQRHVI